MSEHITLLLPSVSTAGNFLIILLCFAIFDTPIDNTIVTIAGNPSGIAATANPTDVINISIGFIFFIIPIINIIKHIAKHAIPNILPTSPSFFCIGVSGVSLFFIRFAIWPTFVFIPVSVTIAVACPVITLLPINAMLCISPNGIFVLFITSDCFSTGKFSPVKLYSSIFKFVHFIILQSAGTLFPASNFTMSPGTNS